VSSDPFGNYLCQKLLEYSTGEQRNVIYESAAHNLVNISLNMHGTRAVQKMIDFLSTRRQASSISILFHLPHLQAGGFRLIIDTINVQIHSIILALSLHVVVLIKYLNGNHVIQKCLNKLAPEDNRVSLFYTLVTGTLPFDSSFTMPWLPTMSRSQLTATDAAFAALH